MSLAFSVSITVLRDSPGGFDIYGDPIASTTASTVLTGCAVAPISSSEPVALGRNGVSIDLRLYAPVGADILYTDRISYEDLIYRVEGFAKHWVSPYSGKDFGFEISLQRDIG